uniref:Uncharacterized protein n=1 Tax=Anguilla anguilla TaxID=7936 RepID=A0A0E9V386_ANGAN
MKRNSKSIIFQVIMVERSVLVNKY